MNFFTDDGVEGAPQSIGNKGAKNSEDFILQRAKIVSALQPINADIVGLIELGNNGQEPKSAIQSLVKMLNIHETDSGNHYSFIYPRGASRVDTDAISVGLIYRASVFMPKGDAAILAMPKEVDGDNIIGQRNSMIQEFCLSDDDSNCLTIVVN